MTETYRALVVEDDSVAREAAVMALEDQGFHCTSASDGVIAGAALEQSSFDVVVTDLRLPHRNGHSLVVELSQRTWPRPLLVVLTGVLDGRLVKDLVARGVDDIDFKPIDFGVFGAKVRALCDRRRRQQSLGGSDREATAAATCADLPAERITAAEIEQRLDSLAGNLPVSEVALEVARLVKEENPSAAVVAKEIAKDPLLTVEVLRLANSTHVHPSGRRIESLLEAVTWIGDRQIGELAIASTTLGALSKVRMPWIDADLLWRRSVASSRAMKQLQSTADVGAEEEGQCLSSLVFPLSRVVLSLAFPERYEKMVAHCQRYGNSLAELERRIFSVSPERALAGILARWKLSPSLCKPLQHAASPYADIANLTEPLRSKVERLRVADCIGHLAVGRFEPWCEMDFPPIETISKLRIEDPGSLVDQVRSELAAIRAGGGAGGGPAAVPSAEPQQPQATVRYFKLSVDCRDMLAALLQTMHMNIERISRDESCQVGASVVNCLDASPERLEWFLDDAVPDSRRILVSNMQRPGRTDTWNRIVSLPCSYQVLSEALQMAVNAS